MPNGIIIIKMAQTNFNAGITSDDIQKTKEYQEALDKLSTSLTGVTTKLPAFADGVDAGLKAIAEKLPEVVDSMMKLNAQNKELAANGQKPVSVFAQLASSMFSWNSVISVGITLITTYGASIVKWIADMIKGEATLSSLAKTMKDTKIVNDALIQTKLAGEKAAQAEIVSLNALYSASQKHTGVIKEQKEMFDKRKEAAKALREQWPEIFQGFKDEEILTGKAAKAYGNLKDQIMAAAYAEAAKNRITANAGRALDNEQKIANERVKNIKIIENQTIAEKKLNDLFPKDGDSALERTAKNLALGQGVLQQYSNDIEYQKKLREASDKIIYDLNTDQKLLNTQNDKLYQKIQENVEKFGVKILDYKDKPVEQNAVSKPNIPQTDPGDGKDSLEAEREKAFKQFQQTAEALHNKIELEKQSYETQKKALQNLLDNKLISQEQYNQESEELEEKFHVGIGEKIERFNREELAKAQKQQQDIVAAQQHKELMEKDAHNVNKAILPTDKLAAEKKLITDKYNFEIQKAAEAGKDTAEIREQYQLEITELTKRHEQERKEFALQTAQKVSDAAFGILKGSIQSQADAKIKGLETQKQAELANTNLTAGQRKTIEDKYKKKEAEEKVKAFKAEQRASILQAVINGALAITKVTSQTGVLSPFVIPGIIAETAIQVATIAKQKAPQYAKGGIHYQSDGRGALLSGYSRMDDTNAYLRSGEAVVVSEAMRNPWARNLVSAINVAYGGRDFSVTNPGHGYAIGGIYTDGGNANRYYNQPVNDVKDLANTVAYQMINNFPPIYVDVKDVNSQQSILAQTINRVNF